METKDLGIYCADDRTIKTLTKAYEHSEKTIKSARGIVDRYLSEKQLDPSKICIVAVGSLGRYEALDASDVDAIPLLAEGNSVAFSEHDQAIRERLQEGLGKKVSKGQELTKCTELNDLLDAETIGGERDTAPALTRRVLILTEGVQIGGKYELDSVHKLLLEVYAKSSRTSGRHVLTLCNDLARYYRTLCIDYKAKVDVENKDWATRNLKLRHSRKVWHLSNMMAVVALASENHSGDEEYTDALLIAFKKPPIFRLLAAIGDRHKMRVSKILEHFALFLQCMSVEERRNEIAKIGYDDRYDPGIKNAYLPMKLNSDLLHKEIMALNNELNPDMRQKLLDWFLF